MASAKTENKHATKHSAGHKVLTAIGIILCVILIPIIIINCTLIIKQFTNKNTVPSFGGVFPMIVLTDSMAGTFDAGSLIFCKTIDAGEVKEGDIICYFDPLGNGTSTVTHRVVEVKKAKDGSISFITKGDANNANDEAPVPQDKLLGIYWFHINGLGSAAMFMQTTAGLIIFVVVPILILVIYDIARRRLYENKNKQKSSELMAELERLRAQKEESGASEGKVSTNAPAAGTGEGKAVTNAAAAGASEGVVNANANAAAAGASESEGAASASEGAASINEDKANIGEE